MQFYTYPQLKTKGIDYSREHIRRLEKIGAFPLHTNLDEKGRRVGWEASLIDKWLAARDAVARANAKVARAEWQRRVKARATQ